MTAQVSRQWQIECRVNGKLKWSQEVIGTRGEAEMALEAYRNAGATLTDHALKLTGGHRLDGKKEEATRFRRRRESACHE